MDFGFNFQKNIYKEKQENEILDNWESVDPELIAKRLEERKKVEDADHELTNDLFSLSLNDPTRSKDVNQPYTKPPKPPKSKNLKIDVAMINETYKKKLETIKNTKITSARQKEIFGEPSLDDIDQLACKIEEAYLYSLDR